MTRSAVALIVCAAAVAAPVPKALKKAPADLMPLEVGAKWEFVSADDSTTPTDTREITAVEERDGVQYFTQKTTGLTQEFRRTAEGVAVVKSSGRANAQPRFILKDGMKEGDTWENDLGGYTEVRTVGKTETIKLPAGEFEAIQVNFKYVQNGATFQSGAVWYAAGVGLVRIDTDGRPSEVLKAYTPGKK